MRHGGVLLLSVFLITIVSSINIVDARRSLAAKKKTATESFLDSDQDFGIEVRSDYGGLEGTLGELVKAVQVLVKELPKINKDLGAPQSALTWETPGTAEKNAATNANNTQINAASQLLKTTNALLQAIPKENKELLKNIGKINGLDLTYDKTADKFYYVINIQGKTDDQIKETIRRIVNIVQSTV